MFAISSTTAVAARVACARRVGAKKFNPLACLLYTSDAADE